MTRLTAIIVGAALTGTAIAGRMSPLDNATGHLDRARDDHAALARLVSEVPAPALRASMEDRLAGLGYHLQEADLAVHAARGDQGYSVSWWGHGRGYRAISASSSSVSSSASSSTVSAQHGSSGISVGYGSQHVAVGSQHTNAASASHSASVSVGHSVAVVQAAVDTDGATSPGEWSRILAEVRKGSWEDDQLSVLRSATANRWFTIDQVIEAMGIFTWSSNKVAVAELMWPRVVDQGEGYRLLSALEWSSDKDKLRASLGL